MIKGKCISLLFFLIVNHVLAMENAITDNSPLKTLGFCLTVMKFSSSDGAVRKNSIEKVKELCSQASVDCELLETTLRIGSLPLDMQNHIFSYVYGCDVNNIAEEKSVSQVLKEISSLEQIYKPFNEKKFMINNPHEIGNYSGFLGSPVGRYDEGTYYAKVSTLLISIPLQECLKMTIDELRLLEKVIVSNSALAGYRFSDYLYGETNRYLDGRYKITESDLPLISKLKQIEYDEHDDGYNKTSDDPDLLELDALKQNTQLVKTIAPFLRVNVHHEPSPFKDGVLIAVPLIFNSIIPDLALSAVDSGVDGLVSNFGLLKMVLQTVGVPVACLGSCVGCGLNLLTIASFCDKYSSSTVTLKSFFGKNVQTSTFPVMCMLGNMLHFTCALIGRGLLASQFKIVQSAGYAVYLARLALGVMSFGLISWQHKEPIYRGAPYKDISQDTHKKGNYIYLLSDIATKD